MLLETFDSDMVEPGQFSQAVIADDVKDKEGRLSVPADSRALLIVRNVGKTGSVSHLILGLNRITIADKSYVLADGGKDLGVLNMEEDAARGAAHRSVHLPRRSRLTFKVEEPVQLH